MINSVLIEQLMGFSGCLLDRGHSRAHKYPWQIPRFSLNNHAMSLYIDKVYSLKSILPQL